MTKFVVDSFAWIEYLTASERGKKVKEYIEDENNEIFTQILSLAEISSRLSRSKINPKESIGTIILNSTIINLSNNDVVNVGILHSKIREKIKDFGLVDTFILLSSRKIGARVITGDPHFKNFKESVMI